jgi:putative DNA primase/helicase
LWPYLFLVEGASDCWSAWLHDEPALGLPGATQANLLLPEYFKDILHVYLAREPGKAGDTFVDGITKRLRAIGYTGEIWDAPMPGGLKDVNEVLQKFPERDAFKDQMLGARTMATLIETEPAPLVLVAEPVTDDGRPMKPYELTAFGNRDRLIDLYGEDMAYAVGMGWMHWDGTRWKRDPERHLVGRRAEIVVKQIKVDAMRIGEQGERDGDLRKTKVAKAMLKWYQRCAARAAVSEMLDLAEKKLLRDHETFDAKPMLFNVANGTIDLSTGVFREHRKSDHLTFLCPVAYDPTATCPRWDLFINEVMQGDAEMVDYMQRGCGYFLTGDTSEQAFFIFWGLGSNGKSTFLEVMRMLLGYDYAKTTPASTFLKKADNNSSAASPEIARLKGARLVTAVETERAQRLATGLVKQQTGDDRTAARHLFQEMMEFQTQYKVILAVNNKPEIQDQSKGMWRRVHLVPWEATFEPGTPGFNPKLKRDLLEELPGILNWAIAGAKRWYEERLEPPTKVRAAVEEYRQEQDELGEFIAGKCVLDRRYDTPIDRLYDLAKAEIPGLRSKKALTQMMDERGIKRDFRRVPEALSNPYMGTDANALGTKSARCYLGIGVVEDVARVERDKKVRAEAEPRLNRGRS